jgi:hypothetical protein
MMAILKLSLILIISISLSIELNLVGGNIDEIADWSRSHCFCDLVKQSRRFGLPDKINLECFFLTNHGKNRNLSIIRNIYNFN